MIECYLAVVADRAILGESNKALTLVEIIDGLDVPLFPMLIPRIFAAFFLERVATDPEAVKLELKIASGDNMIIDQLVDVLFFNGQDRTKAVFEFRGLPIIQAGPLTFTLFDGDRKLKDWTVRVRQVAQVVAADNAAPVAQTGAAAQNDPAH